MFVQERSHFVIKSKQRINTFDGIFQKLIHRVIACVRPFSMRKAREERISGRKINSDVRLTRARSALSNYEKQFGNYLYLPTLHTVVSTRPTMDSKANPKAARACVGQDSGISCRD